MNPPKRPWEIEAEKREEEKKKEEEKRRRQYELDHTVIQFTPFKAEQGAVSRWSGGVPVIESSDLGGYVFCNSNPPNDFWAYWSIFPKPIGFVKTLPDWITEKQFKKEMLGDRPKLTTPWLPASPGGHAEWSGLASASDIRKHREKEESKVKEWDEKYSRRINYEYKDFVAFQTREGRKFTPEELEEILRKNAIVARRSNLRPTSKRLELDVGLNPVGVRQFFETQIFSNPPGVEFTPALLKPYMLSFKRIFDIDLTKPPYNTGKKEVPVALYSGLYYGDTCCGKVFDEMLTADEAKRYDSSKQHTFSDDEERNAFFLQICKMVIAGIDKDGDRGQNCVNHGNYGDCIVDFFKENSDYDCFRIRWNYFIRDRVIMLLFDKVIEANEKVRKVIELQRMKSALVEQTLDPGVYTDYTGKSGRPAPPRKRRDQEMMEGILKPTIHTGKSESHDAQRERHEALLNRYFDIIIEIMKITEHVGRDPNPLNIELCSAETELVPSAPDSEGRVRYVAKFVKPINPDGRTMAHLLALRCPRILMRLMIDPQIKDFFVLKFSDEHNEKYNDPMGVYVEPSDRFIPSPIAYSIPDVNGDTPRSLAIAQLTGAYEKAAAAALAAKNTADAAANNFSSRESGAAAAAATEAEAAARLRMVEARALKFFTSLPDPQPEPVFIEREQFITRNKRISKLKSAVGRLSEPVLSTGLRNMFESRREFEDASEMEGLLTGRNPSMLTGLPSRIKEQSRRTVQPSILEENKETIIPEGMGGGRTRRKSMAAREARKKRRAGTRKQRSRYQQRSSSSAGRNRKKR
jgi:hypothetical protein